MDILAFAMQMEKDGEAYYRQLAHRTSNTGLRTILNMLADEEVKHQQTLEDLQDTIAAVPPCEVLVRAKNIFAEMDAGQSALSDESDQVDLYRKALSLEEQGRTFYQEKASELDDERQASVFQTLAREEAQHAFLLQNIVDFVSRPQGWLEDAEFNHLDAY